MARATRHAAGLFFTDLAMGDVPADPQKWGDVILVRKDIGTSYHIAVVVDDALQDVTHVTRGRDLFEATHIHRLLQALLGLPVPLYHHHPLISDALGRKLSKSAGDRSLRSLREGGASPADIRRALGF
jgi:glutamyl-Q tRNA(Asp) synthetase